MTENYAIKTYKIKKKHYLWKVRGHVTVFELEFAQIAIAINSKFKNLQTLKGPIKNWAKIELNKNTSVHYGFKL